MIYQLDPDYLLADERENWSWRMTFDRRQVRGNCRVCGGPKDRKMMMTCSQCGGEESEDCPCDTCEHEKMCRETGKTCASYNRYAETGRWEPIVGRNP